jgi:hypothetical protein
MGERGRNMGHHRYKIVVQVTGEMQETKTRAEEAVPPDDGVKAKVKSRLTGLDVGSDFKITKVDAITLTKEPIP